MVCCCSCRALVKTETTGMNVDGLRLNFAIAGQAVFFTGDTARNNLLDFIGNESFLHLRTRGKNRIGNGFEFK